MAPRNNEDHSNSELGESLVVTASNENADQQYAIARANAERLIKELQDGDQISPEKLRQRVTI